LNTPPSDPTPSNPVLQNVTAQPARTNNSQPTIKTQSGQGRAENAPKFKNTQAPNPPAPTWGGQLTKGSDILRGIPVSPQQNIPQSPTLITNPAQPRQTQNPQPIRPHAPTDAPKLCRFFRSETGCKFGDSCKFVHQ